MDTTNLNETTTDITETFDPFVCGLINFPNTGIECSNGCENPCVKCPIQVTFMTNEKLDQFDGIGHKVCLVLLVVTLLVEIVGILCNFVVIEVIRRINLKKLFSFLNTTQACVDIFCSISSITHLLAIAAFIENWFIPGKKVLYWLHFSTLNYLFWRRASIYTTLLLSINRYYAVISPFKFIIRNTRKNAKFQAGLALCLCITLSLPGYLGHYIDHNTYCSNQECGLHLPSFCDLQYVVLMSPMYQIRSMKFSWSLYVLLEWLPMPLFFLFIVLPYRKMKTEQKQRKPLNIGGLREFHPLQMFLPLALLHSFINIFPTILFVSTFIGMPYYREIWMISVLTMALNSPANFWISMTASGNYLKGRGFGPDAKQLLLDGWNCLRNRWN